MKRKAPQPSGIVPETTGLPAMEAQAVEAVAALYDGDAVTSGRLLRDYTAAYGRAQVALLALRDAHKAYVEATGRHVTSSSWLRATRDLFDDPKDSP